MLLTKKQYQRQHEVFNKVASVIRSLQEAAKEEYQKDEDKTSYARGLMIGKSSAFEDSYNLLRREADSAYQKEPIAADTQLDSSLNHLEDHLKAVKHLISHLENIDTKDINNVLSVMEAIIKNAQIVIRQTEP
jgi:hypothetical protein